MSERGKWVDITAENVGTVKDGDRVEFTWKKQKTIGLARVEGSLVYVCHHDYLRNGAGPAGGNQLNFPYSWCVWTGRGQNDDTDTLRLFIPDAEGAAVEKRCGDCVHEDKSGADFPCRECVDRSQWTPRKPAVATPPSWTFPCPIRPAKDARRLPVQDWHAKAGEGDTVELVLAVADRTIGKATIILTPAQVEGVVGSLAGGLRSLAQRHADRAAELDRAAVKIGAAKLGEGAA